MFLCAFHVEIRKAAFTINSFDLTVFFHSWEAALVPFCALGTEEYIFWIIRKGKENGAWRAAERVWDSKPTHYLLNRGESVGLHSVIIVWGLLMLLWVLESKTSWWRSEIKLPKRNFVFVFKQMFTGLQSLLSNSTREMLQTGMLPVYHSLDWLGKGLLMIWKIPELVWCQNVRNTLCEGQKGDFVPLGVVNYPTKPQMFYSRHYPRPLVGHIKNYNMQSLFQKSLHLFAEKFGVVWKINGIRQYM